MTALATSPYFWAGLAAAYLVGAVPFAFIIGKVHGVDVREVGSGNVGATNLARALGRKWGIFVLALDISKGLFATALLPWLATRLVLIPGGVKTPFAVCAGIAAVLGHIYPAYLLFKGGKGVATTIGAFGGLLHFWLAIPLAVYFLAAKISDYVSVGSISFAVALPLAAWVSSRGTADNYWVCSGALVAAAFVIWKHRGNIRRLWQGTEPRRSTLKKTDEKQEGHQDG